MTKGRVRQYGDFDEKTSTWLSRAYCVRGALAARAGAVRDSRGIAQFGCRASSSDDLEYCAALGAVNQTRSDVDFFTRAEGHRCLYG